MTRNHNKEGYLVSNKLPNGKFKVILENGKLTSTSSDNIMLIDEKIYFAKGGEISDDDYAEYLNEVMSYLDYEDDEWIIGGKNRVDEYWGRYGEALREYDPIAFEVGKNEYERGYGTGGFLLGNMLGGYLGYKLGKSMEQDDDVFGSERKFAQKVAKSVGKKEGE
jgi:hypothetical protein